MRSRTGVGARRRPTRAPLSNAVSELAGLRAELAATKAELARSEAVVSASEAIISGLKLEIARLKRDKYGRSAERTARLIMLAADRLHGDDTTVPLLARGGTKTARLWTYIRDDRPFAGAVPPAVLFRFSRDRGGEHPAWQARPSTFQACRSS